MSIRSWPRRIRDSVEQEGRLHAAWRLALSPAYRAGTLNVSRLYIRERKPSVPVTVRIATEDDLDALVALRPEYDHDTLRARMRGGHICVLSLVNGELASVRWACTGEAPLTDLGLVLPLEEGELSVYERFVHPAHRLKQVGTPARNALEEHFLEQGFRSIVGYATLGRRPYGREHPDSVATIRTLRLGPFRRFWVRTYGLDANHWRERLKELRCEGRECAPKQRRQAGWK